MSILHMCNANAISLPPLYVFAGVKLIHNMLQGAPAGKYGMQKMLLAMSCFASHAMPGHVV